MSPTVWRIVPDRELARDAVPDAVTVLWRCRDWVRAHPNPRALVLRICMNAALDAQRRSRKERDRMRTELPVTLTASPETKPDASSEADEIAARMLEAEDEQGHPQRYAITWQSGGETEMSVERERDTDVHTGIVPPERTSLAAWMRSRDMIVRPCPKTRRREDRISVSGWSAP